jgi:phosphate starvation-inducible protein PhoH
VTIIQEAHLSKGRNNRATQEVSHYTTPVTHNRNYHRAPPPEHLTLVNDNFHQRRRIELIPKSLNQETYIDLLTDPEKLIIFATGPAGTGKTMLAVMAAIKALKEGECKKIVLTRPAVGVDDEKHGFLPGDLNAKMEPWCIPLFDVINEYYYY